MTKPLSGIYKITNNANGKIYIGQSQNVYLRRKQHWDKLKKKTHPNTDMQKDWNKSNRGFRWDVVEMCPLEELNRREEYWINYYNSIDEGYNKGWVPYKRKTQPKVKKRKIVGYKKRS